MPRALSRIHVQPGGSSTWARYPEIEAVLVFKMLKQRNVPGSDLKRCLN
jgi:hypothetical protein